MVRGAVLSGLLPIAVTIAVGCGNTTRDHGPGSGGSGGITSGSGGLSGETSGAGGRGAGGSNAGTSGSSGDAGAGGTGDGDLCAELDLEAERPMPPTVFVVDLSESMSEPLSGSGPTRLDAVRQALMDCSLGARGLVVFPDDSGCVDPLDGAPLDTQGVFFPPHVLVLEAAGQGAPLGAALEQAYEQLDHAGFLDAPRRVVLITDGGMNDEATCAASAAWETVLEDAEAARTRGITVDVVGLPGSENDAEALSSLAEVFGCRSGASWCHWDLTSTPLSECVDCSLCTLAGNDQGVDLVCSFRLDVTGPADYSRGEVSTVVVNRGTGERTLRELAADEWSVEDGELILGTSACDEIKDTVAISARFECL